MHIVSHDIFEYHGEFILDVLEHEVVGEASQGLDDLKYKSLSDVM